MPKKAKNGFAAPPESRKELDEFYSRVIKKIKDMSSAERMATMVRAGIYTKSGKLTKHCGG